MWSFVLHILPFPYLTYSNYVKRINYFCSLRQQLSQLDLKNANNNEWKKTIVSDFTKLY